MAERTAAIQALVVRFWIHDLEAVRAALAAAELDVAITRVDFEPAMYAALTWGRYDVVIYDATTTTISRDAVLECLHANRCTAPVVELDDVATLGERVAAALRERAS